MCGNNFLMSDEAISKRNFYEEIFLIPAKKSSKTKFLKYFLQKWKSALVVDKQLYNSWPENGFRIGEVGV